MSLMSSDIKLGQDVDPTVRRFQAAITRDLEQLYLLMSQGEGGFSNTSPGSVSQDPTTDGLGVEGNQGDYRFSAPVTKAEVAQDISNATGGFSGSFLQINNNLSDVQSASTSRSNLGLGTMAVVNSPVPIANGGTAGTTAAAARTNLGLGTAAVINVPVSLANGGTAGTTSPEAALNLLLMRFEWGAPTSYTTPGSSTHTFTAGKKVYLAFVRGAGGGGGGGSSGTGTGATAGGGGGQGAVRMAWGKINVSSTSIVVGTGGSGGAATGTGVDGTAGGTSSESLTAGGAPGGGGGGSDLGHGGYGGSSGNGSGGRITMDGESGQPGRMRSISYSGSPSTIVSVSTIGGRGGGPSAVAGSGGDGGSAGNAGAAGADGRVDIYEL